MAQYSKDTPIFEEVTEDDNPEETEGEYYRTSSQTLGSKELKQAIIDQ